MDSEDLNRPVVYNSGSLVFYRASAIGGCARMLALARQGYDPIAPPQKMMEVFERGHEAEREAWVKGILKGRAQENIKLKISDTIFVTGHLDSWEQYHGGEGKIVELKSQNENEFRPIEESPLWDRYSYQISCYMHALPGRELIVRRVKLHERTIVETVDQVFHEPPVSLADIRAKVFKVESLARKDLTTVECEKTQFPCPYFYTHVGGADAREMIEDETAVELCVQYKEASSQMIAIKGRVAASREALLTWMGEKDKIDLPGGWKLTRYTVAGKHVEFDSKGYKALRVTPPRKEDNAGEGMESKEG